MRKGRTSYARLGEPGYPAARAFTIVEATIVIGIIALLVGILLMTIGAVRRKGDVAAELAMVTTLQKAVEKFKQDYGFLPPLVIDGPTVPVNPGTGFIQTWTATDLADPNTTLNGSSAMLRYNFSNYSLAYYLIGALGKNSDGIDGLGFTAPGRDGQFTKRGRKFEPLLDVTQQKTRLGTVRLFIPGNGTATPGPQCVILDRWSDTSNAYPIRYYRWLPGFYAQNAANPGAVQYWNAPIAAGGYISPLTGGGDATTPPTNSELKSAEYAIVSAGPNHAFGDEPIAVLASLMHVSVPANPVAEAALRAMAVADNIIEVGR